MRLFYVPVFVKYTLSTIVAIMWTGFSVWIAEQWMNDVYDIFGVALTWIMVCGIAFIPGFMSAFLLTSLFLDRRPSVYPDIIKYPKVTVLVAAYNEGKNICSTVDSIIAQQYPGEIRTIVVNDGSTDDTKTQLDGLITRYPQITVLNLEQNVGKAAALNKALALVDTEITVTIDGDSYLHKNSMQRLIGRFLSDPDDTAAVAGAVLVRNSRENLVTKAQEWDYFHGIAAIKRMQSLYQGTLVAQGAFSAYKTSVLRTLGGWASVVGEDIVLTWALLAQGHRVGYAEDAYLFTNAPTTWGQFFKQRQRWSRGLIEAFKAHPSMLFRVKMTTMFIWWNVLFPYMDIAYTFVFIPGIIAALCGNYLMAGVLTLLLLPMSLIVNRVIYSTQINAFTDSGLVVRKNWGGFLFYAFLYSFILQPACVLGYVKEIFNGKVKNWGTK